MEEPVGFIGVGAMGSALLDRLRLVGVPVTAYDVSGRALDAARSKGARVAASPHEVGAVSTIIDVVVRTDQDVLDSVLGRDGILGGAKSGSLVLLHSTINPKTTRAVAKEASGKGIQVMDACMVGRPDVVRAGDLCFLAGGSPEIVERARPHLLRMGKIVLHMGPLGSGNVAKIVKNLITGSESLILHEAVKIAAAGGIAGRDALEMLRQLTSGPGALDHWEQTFVQTEHGLAPRVGTNIHDKDLPLAAELARDTGVDAPIAREIAAAGLRLLAAGSASE
jgi:3-hydroxyisobutyrate dehydrogenase